MTRVTVGRRHLRIRPGQRPAHPDPARCVEADDDREPHDPGRLAHGELRRDRDGAPARAPAVQGHAEPSRSEEGDERPRTGVERNHVGRSHQLLREHGREPGQPRLLPALAGRGADAVVHRQEGSRFGDDRRPQRDGVGRERSRPGPVPERARRVVPLAQLRQEHDRRARRRRERRHRAAAGVLPQLLPARQRLPDRRRQVRRGEDARAHRRDLRQDRPSRRACSSRPTRSSRPRTASAP